MCWYLRLFSMVLWLLVSALPVAQSPPVPSGHWEGTLQIPDMELKIEIDLAKKDGGAWAGTFGQPAQGVKGLPLSTVAVDGASIRFVVQGAEAPSTFEGMLADDGQSISGNVTQSKFTTPFTLNRTSDARIAPAPKSPPIGKELEGAWNGTLDLGPRQMRIVLTMANQPDGTATARFSAWMAAAWSFQSPYRRRPPTSRLTSRRWARPMPRSSTPQVLS